MVQKQNAFNVLAVIAAIILIAAISLHFFAVEEKTLSFTGPNIYRAVYVYEAMHEQGYAVALEVEGKWIDTNAEFKGSGTILKGELGEFTILYNNREVTVGGPASAKEDISAKKLSLKTLHEGILKVGAEPLSYSSFDSLNSEILSFSENLVPEQNLYNIGIIGDVMLDSSESLKPTIVQEISNILKGENSITLYEKGIRLILKNAELSDLEKISTLLKSNGVTVTKVSTGRLELLIRTKSEPAESSETLIEKTAKKNFNVYMLKVITSPLP